jgi:ketosteroid isomerase-like protein
MRPVQTLSSIVSNVTEASSTNAEIISRLYEAFVAGDPEAAETFVATDFVMHVPGSGLNAGEYWGRSGFRQFMSNIARHNGGVFDMAVPVFSVTGDDVFTREMIRINRTYDPEKIWTLRISNWLKMRAGKLSELWVIPEDQRLYDEYWTPSAGSQTRGPVVGVPSRKQMQHVDVQRAYSPENHQLLTSMYDAFWRGDAFSMRGVIADDVVVDIVGNSGMSGVYRGWDGYMQFREKLMAMSGERYKLDVIGLAASASDAFAAEYIRMNRRWDRTVDHIFVLMHFQIEGGKIVRMDDFPFDTYHWERFYTPPSDQASHTAEDALIGWRAS